MNNAVLTSAVKAIAELSDTVTSGVHPVAYSITIKDHNSTDKLVLDVEGTVTKGDSELVVPTVSVPWIQVAAELLRSCGVTGESALVRLREALTKVLTSESDIEDHLSKSIADATARIKKEVLAKLPLAEREGKTKVAHKVLESFGVEGAKHNDLARSVQELR